MASVIDFEIREHIGNLAEYENGWAKEVNLVSWNGSEPKFDIREWSPTHEQLSRGITLKPVEMKVVVDLLKDRCI